MRGRKPTPTYLKLLNGNPGKRRLNPNEPKPRNRTPTCPSHLCPSAKAEWKRLAAQLAILQILTEFDRGALAAYCQTYGRWMEAERKLHDRNQEGGFDASELGHCRSPCYQEALA